MPIYPPQYDTSLLDIIGKEIWKENRSKKHEESNAVGEAQIVRHSSPAPSQYRDLIIGIIALVLAMMYWVIVIAPMLQQQFRNVQLF